MPWGVEPKARYDDKVRQEDLGRILEDRMSVERDIQSMHRDFLAVPELAKAVKTLGREKIAKIIAFLASPACRRMRTNNHVERINRKLRYKEKARYKWRRTIVRFLVLLLNRYWACEKATRSRWQDETASHGPERVSPKTVPKHRVA